MIKSEFSATARDIKTEVIGTDFVVVGGGMAGVCAAIAAAREGIRVVLLQDRPVLGGNASSEVRLWVLGATSHMGNNNRFSREGGVIGEILVENMYRNREGNPVIFDAVLLDKVRSEPNITLLLNTFVYDIAKDGPDRVSRVMAFCSQNETFYEVSAPLFCDASGDGILAYKAGASYRVGAETADEYGEAFAPDPEDYGEVLGHSLYFYTKDTGKPVTYTPPTFAKKNIPGLIPRYRNINSGEHGCKYWWLEYGGLLDTIHDTEQIKWELWSIVYGIWDHIKNSGEFPGTENLTLEWVGLISGKRESRRFLGHKTITQEDIVRQRNHSDAVAYGGWAIDLHPAEGVYSKKGGCTQFHSKGIYPIPYGCYVSKEIENLFFAGRNISATHVAHGSTRVMATTAFGGQAVGMAAAMCVKGGTVPASLMEPARMIQLQQALNLAGQSIPGTALDMSASLTSGGRVTASSALTLNLIPYDGPWYRLEFPVAQMLPLEKGTAYNFTAEMRADKATTVEVELRHSHSPANYTPDVTVERVTVQLELGLNRVTFGFAATLPAHQYGFLTFMYNEHVEIRMSESRYTGIVSVFNKFNHSVNNYGRQTPPPGAGIDSFEFWCPDRRPGGHNIALEISPAIGCFGPENVLDGNTRPTAHPNAWIASPVDRAPALTVDFPAAIRPEELLLYFDTDHDHAMETVQYGHPESVAPFCVRNYKVKDGQGNILFDVTGNYQTINRHCFPSGTLLDRLVIEMEHPSGEVPASLFQIFIK